jgi:CRP-like cAMP-binding protein
MSLLKLAIEAIYPFPQNEMDQFLLDWRQFSLDKGAFLIKAGEISSHLYFLERGAIRCFDFKEGREITEWIAMEGRFIYSPRSLFLREPGRLSFQIVEPSVIHAIHVDDLEEKCAKFLHVAQFYRLVLSQGILAAEKRVEFLLTSSAVERYRNLVLQFPEIVKRVPLSFIASYIGITKETLSRVRGRKVPIS